MSRTGTTSWSKYSTRSYSVRFQAQSLAEKALNPRPGRRCEKANSNSLSVFNPVSASTASVEATSSVCSTRIPALRRMSM